MTAVHETPLRYAPVGMTAVHETPLRYAPVEATKVAEVAVDGGSCGLLGQLGAECLHLGSIRRQLLGRELVGEAQLDLG